MNPFVWCAGVGNDSDWVSKRAVPRNVQPTFLTHRRYPKSFDSWAFGFHGPAQSVQVNSAEVYPQARRRDDRQGSQDISDPTYGARRSMGSIAMRGSKPLANQPQAQPDFRDVSQDDRGGLGQCESLGYMSGKPSVNAGRCAAWAIRVEFVRALANMTSGTSMRSPYR